MFIEPDNFVQQAEIEPKALPITPTRPKAVIYTPSFSDIKDVLSITPTQRAEQRKKRKLKEMESHSSSLTEENTYKLIQACGDICIVPESKPPFTTTGGHLTVGKGFVRRGRSACTFPSKTKKKSYPICKDGYLVFPPFKPY